MGLELNNSRLIMIAVDIIKKPKGRFTWQNKEDRGRCITRTREDLVDNCLKVG
jgi:hypothetical protein